VKPSLHEIEAGSNNEAFTAVDGIGDCTEGFLEKTLNPNNTSSDAYKGSISRTK
jgi:hypothetical protein